MQRRRAEVALSHENFEHFAREDHAVERAGPHMAAPTSEKKTGVECVLTTKERNVACWWSCGRARASLWDLVGAAISRPEVGLLTTWAAVGGAAGLVAWLPSENLELETYEG